MTKTRIHLLTIIQGLILVVYENAHGYHFEALSPTGEIYRHTGVYYSASSAKAKGKMWVRQLTTEEEDF